MRALILLVYLLLLNIYAWPQSKAELNLGDVLPDNTVLSNAFNYPGGKIPLKDFRGKLLLIDFWSTWCSSCIEGFSKLHELQDKFKDQIQVVLVNTEQGDTEQKVRSLFEHRQQRTGTAVTLPYVLQDSVLATFFPHKSVPHYAWINAEGKVIAITSAQEVTEQNIRAVLNGDRITLHRKRDQLNFDTARPLFIYGNGGESTVPLYRSMITGYIEGIGSLTGGRRDKNGQLIRHFFYNQSLLTLLRAAFRDSILYPDNRVMVEGNSTALQQIKHSVTTNNEEWYCYELIMPPCSMEQALETMRGDLLKAFSLTVCNEKRKVKALVLTASKNISSAYTKGGKSEALFEKDRVHKYLRNYAVKDMLWLLNNASDIPVIDETGITRHIDMDLPDDMQSEEQWKAALKKAGFIIQITDREMDMTIISHRDN